MRENMGLDEEFASFGCEMVSYFKETEKDGVALLYDISYMVLPGKVTVDCDPQHLHGPGGS